MGKNNLDKLKDCELVGFAKLLSGKTASGGYGLPVNLPQEIADASEEMSGNLTAVDVARNAYRSRVAEKSATRQRLVRLLSTAAGYIYSDPDLSDTEIISVGLKPRKEGRTPVKPTTPQSFIVVPRTGGQVELSWNRSGNPQGVVFNVEARRGGGPWQIIQFTTRCNITLRGFPPGEPAFFRVSAHKTIYSSPPSMVQSIYWHEAYSQAA